VESGTSCGQTNSVENDPYLAIEHEKAATIEYAPVSQSLVEGHGS